MRHLMLTLFGAAALAVLPGCLDSLHHAHSHSHDHAHHGDHVLTLNNGSKWETDEALRHGMTGIRDLVEPHRAGGGDYGKLTEGIQANIQHVVKNCKLEPEADAVLHVILGEVFEGMALIEGEKGEGKRQEGVERILHALENYGQYFDHPGWEEMHASH